MRRHAALGAAALLSISAGCTFLASFDDVARPDAGTPDDEPPPVPTRDATPPPSRDAGGPETSVDAGCDLAFPSAQVKGCGTFDEGARVCADNALITSYPAGRPRATDLLTCSRRDGGVPSCVFHCRGKGGCAGLPSGFPDQCDPCDGRPNGRYCGSEVGFVAENRHVRVECVNDVATKTERCTACTPAMRDAGCTP